MELYFVRFLASASVATAPGPDTARSRWLAARVSGHAKSQTRHRPSFQGAVVSPSGRFPSSRDGVSDDGSSLAGTSADASSQFSHEINSFSSRQSRSPGTRPKEYRQASMWNEMTLFQLISLCLQLNHFVSLQCHLCQEMGITSNYKRKTLSAIMCCLYFNVMQSVMLLSKMNSVWPI